MIKIVQLLVDLYGCEVDLDDDAFLLSTLERGAEAVRARVVKKITHRFSPQGVSIILILAETHISIHTWPEHRYAAVDIFICGEGKDPKVAWEAIREGMKPESFEIKEIIRTIGDKRS